ncbi:T9SS type B sorting domain-containing protein [Mesoflavibacter zeaxanthinifaciens]|uniref:T9SS type B sorting domain-containing protein n=1 Tax=Mesoflavibacter zeaxanthinifaciens TaxID=393060 RepID=UPI0026F02403|nr:T9SS type B sorting domain-containing protein [Mesoflavibacter zeaxanthinifaciens]
MKHIYFLLALIVLSSNTLLATSCPDPIINTINPNSGPANTLITINGSNFSTTSQITIGGISTTYNIIDNTHIEVFIPTGTNGLSDLIINTSGGCSTTAATQINVLDSSCNASEIYISEIYDSEPGSYGVIELYNPSNTTVTLDGIYDIERYGDIGNATPSITVPLVNTIGPQQTYILQMGSNGNTCSVSADTSVGSGFNDNDEFKLLKNGVVIDAVEALNERGYSFIRNPNAIAPVSIFSASDWSISGTEDCSDLDNHTTNFNSSNPTITHPNSQTICDNSNISFTTNVDTGSYTYQWFALNSVGVWIPLNNDSTFSGVNTNTLSITNASTALDNSQYYCQMVSTDCNLYSNTAQLYILNPPVDTISDQTVCQDYTLPTLTNGSYFSGANGSGTMLNAGDVISTSQTIYIYNEIGTAPNTCSNESSFTVTVSGNPPVDTISDQTVCQDYTLPTLTNGSYFSGTNGSGTVLNAGDVISTSQTIYIYNEIGTAPNTCSNESSFTVTISGNPPVDTISDQTVCQDYTLPTLTNGNYFSGANGSGTMLNAGDVISTSQTIYIYNEIGTAPNTCSNESSFTVTISGNPPVDIISDQTVCQDYTLPTLTNGSYFTGTNGSGTMLNAGDIISTSQTIYIYNEIGTAPNMCSNESSFTVTISGNPPVDTISDQTVCQDYTLPTLTNGNYFTGANGSGTMLNAGDVISTSQTIYIYNEIGTAPNTCSNESSFTVTVLNIDFTLDQNNITIIEDTITVSMSDNTIFYEYSLDNITYQNSNTFSNLSNGTYTLFVRDINGCVVRQLNFDINVSVVNELFIPKYFTPNGDAYNQVWQIIDPNQIIKEIYIFDRYGKLLKQVSTVHLSWNGMYNGNVLPTNDYWYLINLKSGEQLKGHFTLKR